MTKYIDTYNFRTLSSSPVIATANKVKQEAREGGLG